jgi:hypothetical protein
MPHVFAQVDSRARHAPPRSVRRYATDLDPLCVPAIMTRALLYTQAEISNRRA